MQKPLESGSEPLSKSNSRIHGYSCREQDIIRSKLCKTLGPEFISQRQGPGGRKLAYISGDKCINVANYVFGFDGWSSVIRNVQTDFVEESSGKVSIGVSVVLRVVLKDGTFHEDIGYGEAENVRGKGPAFARAKKAGQTDALKRCLRNFGEVFNCLSDDNYVKKVLRLKAKDKPLDEANLLRSIDHGNQPAIFYQRGPVDTPQHLIKKEVPRDVTAEIEDEYGGDEFDDLEFLVEDQDLEGFLDDDSVQAMTTLPKDQSLMQTVKSDMSNRKVGVTAPNIKINNQALAVTKSSDKSSKTQEERTETAPDDKYSAPNVRPRHVSPPLNQLPAHTEPAPAVEQDHAVCQSSKPSQIQKAWDQDRLNRQELNKPLHQPAQQVLASTVVCNTSKLPATFYSAKAELSDAARIEKPVFNPHLQSPSIPRSAGVDHSKSTPIPRGKYSAQTDTSPFRPGAVSRPNFNGPGNISLRPVGAPSQLSPGNKGYKPPTMSGTSQYGNIGCLPQKRAFEGMSAGNFAQRNILSEATKAQVNIRDSPANLQPSNFEPKDHDLAVAKKART